MTLRVKVAELHGVYAIHETIRENAVILTISVSRQTHARHRNTVGQIRQNRSDFRIGIPCISVASRLVKMATAVCPSNIDQDVYTSLADRAFNWPTASQQPLNLTSLCYIKFYLE